MILWLKNNRVDVSGAMKHAENHEPPFFDAEVSAIISVHMQAQARPDPIAGHASVSDTRDPDEIGDQRRDKAISGDGIVGGDVIVDAIEVRQRGSGQYECTGLNSGISYNAATLSEPSLSRE